MRKWRIDDSKDLYNIRGWGINYFDINEKGNATVSPLKSKGPTIDLNELVQELAIRDVATPMLLRFPDILDNRIEKINECFTKSIHSYEDRKSTRLNSSHVRISYAVFCLKKKSVGDLYGLVCTLRRTDKGI